MHSASPQKDPNVFWGITVPQNNQNKRKLSKENSANENETTKRMRLPSESSDVEILPLSSDNIRKRVQDLQPQRIKEEPIEDFFERDKTVGVGYESRCQRRRSFPVVSFHVVFTGEFLQFDTRELEQYVLLLKLDIFDLPESRRVSDRPTE